MAGRQAGRRAGTAPTRALTAGSRSRTPTRAQPARAAHDRPHGSYASLAVPWLAPGPCSGLGSLRHAHGRGLWRSCMHSYSDMYCMRVVALLPAPRALLPAPRAVVRSRVRPGGRAMRRAAWQGGAGHSPPSHPATLSLTVSALSLPSSLFPLLSLSLRFSPSPPPRRAHGARSLATARRALRPAAGRGARARAALPRHAPLRQRPRARDAPAAPCGPRPTLCHPQPASLLPSSRPSPGWQLAAGKRAATARPLAPPVP